MYLNKAGFNGMYRVNSKGEFNVPWNQSDKVKIINESNIDQIINYFSKTKLEIYNEDFEIILDKAKEGDFVFVDPPYDETYNQYSKNKFNREDQKRLFNKLKELDNKGVYWILCNNPTPFITDLYKEYSNKTKDALRSISSNKLTRKNSAQEIFYFNYSLPGGKKNE